MEDTNVFPSVPEYLKHELNEIAKKHHFLEYNIHVDKGCNHGDGFMATMIAVTVKGQQCHNGVTVNRELPLICKILPVCESRRKAFSADTVFEREAYFYNTISPIFVQLLKEKNISVDEEFTIHPKCFAAIYEPDTDRCLIIMENLKSIGFDLWNKRVPHDFETVGMVLSELGKFHAVSFAIRDQKKEIFDKMFTVTEPFLKMFRGNGAAETMVSGSIQQTIDVLDDVQEIKVMQMVKDNYQTWIREYLKSDAAGRFSVLNHGDLWNNNLMFKLENQNRQLRLVDFQLLRLTSPVMDISYFLSTSTNPTVLQRFDDLLQIYYNSLATFLTKLGSDPQKLFTFDDLEDQFRQFGDYGLIFASILIGVMVSDAEDIIDMDLVKDDTKANGLATLNDDTKMLLKERISSVIQLAIKAGWVKI
ncbi:hypothetical protein Bhyg_16078 [Pseudolycoriella hygida]|uniref:CHK kinase-like domain-containing protein n=1 Tax=Pseudolycoriella hygida TaxID=35572 RepID=A0A9Q0MMF5_9DIPT|nr:hypothetical protein Bhyg_16078 [Pseudolycoriella hygida]